jgi:hypothetical protein
MECRKKTLDQEKEGGRGVGEKERGIFTSFTGPARVK